MGESTPQAAAIQEQAARLERAVQDVAFAVLRDSGDYELSQQLLEVGSDLGRISRRLRVILEGAARQPADASPQPTVFRTRAAVAGYPQYWIDGEKLVKVGKGKGKTAREYRHEANREALNVFGRWLESVHAEGQREWPASAATEALSDTLPSYQVYVLLGALREVGVLQQVSRGTYALKESGVPSAELWSLLQSRLPRNEGR